jgi:hypothetical protein
MKKNELARRLHGMDLNDLPSEMDSEARRAGLVVVLGVSQELVKFYGALTDEIDIPEGGAIYFDQDGILPHPDDVAEEDQPAFYARKTFAASIDAERNTHGFEWVFSTVLPYAQFVAANETRQYCRGIVFKLQV